MIPLVFTEDANGKFSHEGMRQPSLMDFIKLVAHAGVTLAVPTEAKHVLFSSANPSTATGVGIFVKYTDDIMTSVVYGSTSSDTASAARTAGIGMEQFSTRMLRSLAGVTGLSIISPGSGDLTLAWFG